MFLAFVRAHLSVPVSNRLPSPEDLSVNFLFFFVKTNFPIKLVLRNAGLESLGGLICKLRICAQLKGVGGNKETIVRVGQTHNSYIISRVTSLAAQPNKLYLCKFKPVAVADSRANW